MVEMECIAECTSHLCLLHKLSREYSDTKVCFCRTEETRKAILLVKQIVGPSLELVCQQPAVSGRDYKYLEKAIKLGIWSEEFALQEAAFTFDFFVIVFCYGVMNNI